MSTLAELKQMVWENIDDAPTDLTVMKMFDRAQNRIASAVGAKFPKFVTNNSFDPNSSPVWDEKWHEALVCFACARFKESETSLNEVQNFQMQFDDIMAEMTENYQIPIIYRDDRLTQQFSAVAGQTQYAITKMGYSQDYGNLRVFINGTPTTDFMYPSDGTLGFNLNSDVILNTGDTITALWDEHYDYMQSPYPWQSQW